MDSGSLNAFSDVAYRCLKKTREERPTMTEIVKELEFALQQHELFEGTMRIKNLPISPILNPSQNQLLKHGGLVGDGNTVLPEVNVINGGEIQRIEWLSKLENGEVCEIISAIKCISGDSLLHDSIENSRFSNVLRGVMYNGFTVKAKTHFLSLNVTYSVNLLFKHNSMVRTDHGSTHIPFKFKLDLERHYSNSCIAHVREDGWMMIELCQFTSYKTEHDVEIDFLPLFTITSSSVEYFLEGIEFRPVEYVS